MIDFFLKHKNFLILLFTGVYLVTFTVNAFLDSNFEFLYYTILMVVLIYLVIIINKRLHLAFFILFNQSLLGFVHLLGGNYYIGSTRLYDYFLVSGLLSYDNIVHTYGTFIATLTLYSLIANFIDERVRQRFAIFAFGLVLMGLGMGTINELAEFFAVVFLDAAEQVGGYYNNSLDLLFNTLGSILACVIIYFYIERPRILKRINERLKQNN